MTTPALFLLVDDMAQKDRRRKERREAPVERERPRAAWWGYVCHGRADRCLAVNGRPMPLCARCFGFYLGLLIGVPVGFVLSMYIHLDLLQMILVAMAGIGPLILDGGTQHMGWRESTNGIRLATGLLAGVTITAIWTEMLIYGAGL